MYFIYYCIINVSLFNILVNNYQESPIVLFSNFCANYKVTRLQIWTGMTWNYLLCGLSCPCGGCEYGSVCLWEQKKIIRSLSSALTLFSSPLSFDRVTW